MSSENKKRRRVLAPRLFVFVSKEEGENRIKNYNSFLFSSVDIRELLYNDYLITNSECFHPKSC